MFNGRSEFHKVKKKNCCTAEKLVFCCAIWNVYWAEKNGAIWLVFFFFLYVFSFQSGLCMTSIYEDFADWWIMVQGWVGLFGRAKCDQGIYLLGTCLWILYIDMLGKFNSIIWKVW